MSKHKHKTQENQSSSVANGSTSTHANGQAHVGSLQEEISQKAYHIYLAEGRPEGHELEHWLAAEALVQGTRSMPDVRS